jgi:hypothetical protein
MRYLSGVVAVLVLGLSWAMPASADCAMCTYAGSCTTVAHDGFRNCTNNECSGNCRYRPGLEDCWEVECYRAGPGSGAGEKSASTCGGYASAKTFTSALTARDVFQMSEQDVLLSQAVLTFERSIGRNGVSEQGAFSFALPQSAGQLEAVLNGRQLTFTPFRPVTGFADYVVTTGANGQLDVTMRIWEVSMARGQPIDGLTVFLQYDTQASTMRLSSVNKVAVMPAPVDVYFYRTGQTFDGRNELTPDRDTRL